jgi:hypothetical protein
VRAVSEPGAVRIEWNGVLQWRMKVETDFLRYLRVVVSPSGTMAAIGQSGEGFALLVMAQSVMNIGLTLGMFPVALRYEGETLHTYRCGPEDFVPLYLDGVEILKMHAVEGIRDVLADGTIIHGQQTAAGVFDGHNFGQYTRKDGWIVGQSGFSIACLHEATHQFFTARRGSMAEGVHFATQGSTIAVVAFTEAGSFFQTFTPPYPVDVVAPPIPPPPPPDDEVDMSFDPKMPNRLDVVAQVKAAHPAEWDAREDLRFIKRLAWTLHQIDSRFGLLGKRQTDVIAADTITFLNPTVDPQLAPELSCEAADVIGASHTANAQPAWNPITVPVREGGAGAKWIKPQPVGNEFPPPPVDDEDEDDPPPVDLAPILARLLAAEAKITELQRAEADLLDQVHQLDGTTVKVGQPIDPVAVGAAVAAALDGYEVNGKTSNTFGHQHVVKLNITRRK